MPAPALYSLPWLTPPISNPTVATMPEAVLLPAENTTAAVDGLQRRFLAYCYARRSTTGSAQPNYATRRITLSGGIRALLVRRKDSGE